MSKREEAAKVYAWAMAQRTDRPSDHHILLALAWRAEPSSYISSPGVAGIAQITGLERKTIMSGLARLVARGLIKVAGQAGVTARLNEYQLAAPRVQRVSHGDA